MRSRRGLIHPATLFILLTLGVVLLVWLFDIYGLSVYDAQSNSYLRVQNLLNAEGVRWLMRHSLSNFTEFAPLGMAIVSLLGIGIAEDSGYLEAASHQLLRWKIPSNAILVFIILLGVLSNVVGDMGYVFLIPLVAVLSPRFGIHPVASVLITFVSVACGYSANLMLSSMDPLLARITGEVSTLNGIVTVSTGSYINYYFLIASTFLITGVVFLLSKYRLIPQLEKREYTIEPMVRKVLSHREKRSLIISSAVGTLFLAVIMWLTFSSIGLFRGVSGELLRSPFIMGALVVLSSGLGLTGLIYGLSSGRYRNQLDVVKGLTVGVRQLSVFFVIVFFAAQFFACLAYTRLDQFVILYLGQLTAHLSLGVTSSLVVFILYVTTVNLVMVSAVGKWALIAPVFIPLFWSMGVSPDILQAAYRIGDSATNGITPFLYYIPFVLAVLAQYKKKISFSFLFKNTWYFSVTILISWILLFFIWFELGIPFGV